MPRHVHRLRETMSSTRSSQGSSPNGDDLALRFIRVLSSESVCISDVLNALRLLGRPRSGSLRHALRRILLSCIRPDGESPMESVQGTEYADVLQNVPCSRLQKLFASGNRNLVEMNRSSSRENESLLTTMRMDLLRRSSQLASSTNLPSTRSALVDLTRMELLAKEKLFRQERYQSRCNDKLCPPEPTSLSSSSSSSSLASPMPSIETISLSQSSFVESEFVDDAASTLESSPHTPPNMFISTMDARRSPLDVLSDAQESCLRQLHHEIRAARFCAIDRLISFREDSSSSDD